MNMTHYMQLLATNQPWNLIIFMAIPVILTETVVATELVRLFTGRTSGVICAINRWSAIVIGIYFVAVFVYLTVHVVVPLTANGGWRGPIDVVAVGFYLLGIVSLGGDALLNLGLLAKARSAHARLKLHVAFVGLFLLTAHVAMIAGMMDPTVIGGARMAAEQGMPDMPTH